MHLHVHDLHFMYICLFFILSLGSHFAGSSCVVCSLGHSFDLFRRIEVYLQRGSMLLLPVI